jgi:adenylate cyclase
MIDRRSGAATEPSLAGGRFGQTRRTEEARDALTKSIAASPPEYDVYVGIRIACMRPENHEHLLDGTRKARWQV